MRPIATDGVLTVGQGTPGASATGAGGAWLTEDFSSYATTAALRAASWVYAPDTTWGTASGISLDTTEGYGTSDRCMKTSFAIGDAGQPGQTINMLLPTTTIAEYWSEFWVKVSTSFDSDGGGAGNPDYKFIFWGVSDPPVGRNEIKIGNYGDMHNLDCRYNAGPDTLRITTTNVINSGVWHRYRAHNKVTGGSGAIFSVEFWDGTNAAQLLEQTGFSLSMTELSYIVLGANRNRTALVPMWIKWGKITLYNANPGWGF